MKWEEGRRPRTRPIEMQQLALPKLIAVAIEQEAGEDPCCPGHHHPCLQDNEGRRHFDKAPFSQAPTASCTKQCHCVRGDHLGGQEPQYSLSSLCVLSSPGSASTHCPHRGWGRGATSPLRHGWTPFKVGEKRQKATGK